LYNLKSEMAPSVALMLLGFTDCITTVIGVIYFGAAELNPFLTAIIGTSIWAFLALKISATLFIGFTYVEAKSMLSKVINKETKSFKFSRQFLKIAYACLVMFLIVVVVNNFFILMR
jgi:hypothetical protein